MSELLELVKKDAEERMHKSVDALKAEFVKIRTGRAHTSLLDHVKVDYYGSEVPLNQAANVTVLDIRTLGVSPWEKNMVGKIEKAIRDSDLGLNPTNLGDTLRVPLPPMTEDRRRELVRVVKHETETARVAIRNIRRDANHELKNLVKDKEISEDDERRAEEVIQKLTDKYVAKVDEALAEKEAELMEV
ncbi:ribosome recycling factor [Thioflexithrix psekupsensis]|uniref:Ribosome-recycling factor n=1 Tax=Thioflexithrix psekupsensis TaxID=1570016 RepID=A0A251XBB5_9GAMM|nr:ribosome recycling factor [Thioflexithrix psekupsensis]OUD15732.1 ribosome recycling factor [Thioflexithrix psekupsensis]